MSLVVHDITGNGQRLDGGALFGNAPKQLWQRWFEPDSKNRIDIACRALLVRDGNRRVLLETGIGSFFDPTQRERYGVTDSRHILLESLAAQGLSDSDIDVVVLSHLHFDHAGGLLSQYKEGTEPTLLFPNATFITSQTAFARSQAPHPRDKASFIPRLGALLERSGRLELIASATTESDTLGSRFTFCQSDGHTPGMLHTTLLGKAEQLFFCADLIPGLAWVHAAITMGYDRFAEQVVDEKTAQISKLEANGSWLFFTHDPQFAAAQVERSAKGKFQGINMKPHFESGWDLDATS